MFWAFIFKSVVPCELIFLCSFPSDIAPRVEKVVFSLLQFTDSFVENQVIVTYVGPFLDSVLCSIDLIIRASILCWVLKCSVFLSSPERLGDVLEAFCPNSYSLTPCSPRTWRMPQEEGETKSYVGVSSSCLLSLEHRPPKSWLPCHPQSSIFVLLTSLTLSNRLPQTSRGLGFQAVSYY